MQANGKCWHAINLLKMKAAGSSETLVPTTFIQIQDQFSQFIFQNNWKLPYNHPQSETCCM